MWTGTPSRSTGETQGPGPSGLRVLSVVTMPRFYCLILLPGDLVCARRRLGFVGCLGKPFEKSSVKRAVEAALRGEWFAYVKD